MKHLKLNNEVDPTIDNFQVAVINKQNFIMNKSSVPNEEILANVTQHKECLKDENSSESFVAGFDSDEKSSIKCFQPKNENSQIHVIDRNNYSRFMSADLHNLSNKVFKRLEK